MALALAVLAAALSQPAGALAQSPCIQDEPIPTPRYYAGWEKSAKVAWEAVEEAGGVVPEIEEDRSQAPPAWWRHPSPLRSAVILADEARRPDGLYEAVRGPLRRGDLLVRARGADAGACGKMAMLGEQMDGGWMTLDGDGALATKIADPIFFSGGDLRPDASAFRIRVAKEDTLGHVRELRRDLGHLESTIGERPPLIAKNGREAVDQKVHDLVDEAWSLQADPKFDLDRRELAGRALTLGAALDWPGAAAAAAGVLDAVLRRAPDRGDALQARAALYLLGGQADRALPLARAAAELGTPPPRARYLLGRALLAGGKNKEGLDEIARHLKREPADPRGKQLLGSSGLRPALAPAPAASAGLSFSAGADDVTMTATAHGFDLRWPVTWRVAGMSAFAEVQGAIIVNLLTGRVVQENGEAERGTVLIYVEKPDTPQQRAGVLARAVGSLFPKARRKPMKPLLSGSKREQIRDRMHGEMQEGQVTTIEKSGVVYVLVTNAPPMAYGKLRQEFETFVKSLAFR